MEIIFEDENIIVVNKPKGLLVHPTSYKEANTLVSLLKDKIKIEEFEDKTRPGIVHRLDKDTSGLMVIAKDYSSYLNLMKQIKEHKLNRKYLAIVHHNLKDDRLILKLPIARSKSGLLKMVVSDDTKAKEAITEIKLIKQLKNACLIECSLFSGRTHQIRVHLAHIHHPIFNDELYGKNDGFKNYGQFLHAYYLSFYHPLTNKLLEFHCDTDKTFNELLNKLHV